MVIVTKFDGRKQPLNKGKIIRTCLRMHVTHQQANEIAKRIEKEAYDGISTKEILRKIFSYIKKYRPELKNRKDLRGAIAFLRSKPDFEQFISLLLKEYGYEIETNQIIPGKCVEHEIDVIARKKNEILFVEVKHHFQYHTYTGVSVFLEVQAEFEDLVEGYKTGKHKIKFNKALIVCNTKISEHAKRYAVCRGIRHIAWRYPEEKSLEKMIEEKKLYPITILKSLDMSIQTKLADKGIILLKQLVEMNLDELVKKTRIEKVKIKGLIKKAKELLL